MNLITKLALFVCLAITLIGCAPKLAPEAKAKFDLDLEAIKYRRWLVELIQPRLKNPKSAKFDLEPKVVGKWMIFIDGSVTSEAAPGKQVTQKLQGVWGKETETADFESWGFLFDDIDALKKDKIADAMVKVKRDAGETSK